MAIDTSMLTRPEGDKKPGGKTGKYRIDISAFGYSWGEPDVTNMAPAITAKEPPKVLTGTTISSPDTVSVQRQPVSRFVDFLRDYLPEPLSEGLVGTGYKYGAIKEDTGLLQFLLPGFTKSTNTKIDNRVEQLMTPRKIGGEIFKGFSKERAAEIAVNDVLGTETKDVTPLEQKILNSVGRWESVDTVLDTLNFVPLIGASLRKGFQTQLGRIAKSTDAIFIGKELDVIFPKLDKAIKASLVPKLVKAKTVDDVAKLVGEATQKAAKISATSAPVLREIATGKAVTTGEAAAEEAAKIAAREVAGEVPSFVKRGAISAKGAATSSAGRPLVNRAAEEARTASVLKDIVRPIDTALPEKAPIIKTGEPIDVSVFRGTGDTQKVFTRTGESIMTNSAKYYAFTKQYAQEFGDKIEEAVVSLKKPFVIRNDDDLESFRVLTGGNKLVWTWDDDAKRVVAENARRRQVLLDKGYDSLVIQLDPMSETRKTRTIFGNSQVVMLDGQAAKGATKSVTSKVTQATGQAANITKANQTPIQIGNEKPIITNTDVPPAIKVADESFDAGAVSDLAKREAITLKPVRAMGQKIVKGRNLAKEIEANVLKYNDKMPDKEIAAIREQNLLGPESLAEIVVRKRGIVTNAMSIERRKLVSGTLQDIIDLPVGTTVTKEQKDGIESILQYEREINKALKVLMDNGGIASTPEERKLIARLEGNYSNMPEDQLLNHAFAESTRNLKKAEIVYLGIRSETGRALQSMSYLVEGIDNRLRILFTKINNNAKLSELEKQAMFEMVEKLDLDDPVEFMKIIDKLNTSDWFDKVAEWSVAAKLWNPTTHVVNFAGNTLRTTTDIVVKTATNPMVAKADMQGAAVGLKNGLKNALKALTDDGYAQKLAKYVETGGQTPAIKGRLGYWVRTPFRFLGASDEIFKNVAYQRKLYRDAYTMASKEGLSGKQLNARMEELLNNPTFKMSEDATEESKRMTFQEDLGDFMTKVDTLRTPAAMKSKPAKAAATVIRFFVPFLKTPTNLFKQAIDFSLLGLVKNGVFTKNSKFWKAVKAKDQETVGTILGESILGTAIATYIAMETLDGNITGGAPKDPGEKDRFYREKKIPYAMKVGDYWFEYKRLDPFASIIGLTADMVTLDDKNLVSLLHVVTENLKDKSYLSGVSDLMKVVAPNNDWEGEYAFKSMVLGAILPSFVGHTSRSIDPTIRVADTIGQRLLVQIPGMSELFPAKVNVLGYDVQRANKGLMYFFMPVGIESAKIDPVTEELMNIDKTITLPETSFTRTDKRTKIKTTYKFTDAEYEDYARFVGVKLRYELEKVFKTPRYKGGDDEEKIAIIVKLRDEIQTEYKDEYVKEKTGSGKPTNIQRAKNILQGRDPNAPPLEDADSIRSYFMNE